ncbi:SRPBCC family protein [Demequina capsici]|uniref:SRPBCC family protein n=1 Tax=Demequina capsici TaxID=3075620 RepID=A0AA96F481_9MICO|nr:SRPBCC family protein [Demequina sp. OYTSA14]WNM23613.1 SRPBCC family protein [Demequina sp. OYTSA14]
MAAVPYIETHAAEGFVRASALELWNLLTDPKGLADTRDDIQEIELLEDDLGIGDVGGRTRTMLKVGRTDLMLTEETVEADRPRRLVRRALNPRVTSTSTWELEDAPGGTKVTVTSVLETQLGMIQRWAVQRGQLQRGREAIDAVRDQCEQFSVYFDKRRETLSFDI